ncbi:MAG: tetratricopeptide repeat protein [Anaerolineaceae bacterium]|nr:tetratricopeptide repeat protein [Anaerolineaceae bacterium]
MSTAEQNLFETAKKALENGERERAKDLLARLLKINSKDAEYWLWMSAVVDSTKEQLYCLREAQKLDPKNSTAKRGLTMLGAIPIDEKEVIPLHLQKHNWQSAYPDMTNLEKLLLSPTWVQISTIIGLLASISVIIALVVIGAGRLNINNIFAKATSTPNLPPTYNPNLITETPTLTATFPGPTPLWMVMQATYTPTALYINTPHPRTEDYRIAMKAFANQDWDTAIEYFELVTETEPEAADIYYYLAECYRLKGDVESALISYEISLQFNRQFAPAYAGRAQVSMMLDEPPLDSIYADLNKAIRMDPDFMEAYILLANFSLPQEPLAALDYLELALAINPNSTHAHAAQAKAFLINDQAQEALEAAQKINQLDITFLPAYRLIAEAYFALELPENALGVLMTYTLYHPEDLTAQSWLAQAYMAVNETEKAIAVLKDILKLDSRNFESNYQLGLYYTGEDNLVLAGQYLSNALKTEPRSFPANLALGFVHLQLDKPGSAYETLGYAFGLAENDQERAKALYYRAQALELLGEINPAIRDWKSILGFPEEDVPQEWIEEAEQRVATLIPITITPSKTTTRLIDTRVPTWTRRPTDTRQPTITTRPTQTLSASITPTATKTPNPSKNPTETEE